MKKTLFLFLSLTLLTLFFINSKSVLATGVFQLIDFATTTTVMDDTDFSQQINFLYSGNSVPEAQFLSYSLPDGAKISAIEDRGAGLYRLTLSGSVEKSGVYPLSLVLTDNNGALLTQSCTLKIVKRGVVFLTNSLLKAETQKTYSESIDFSYIGFVSNPIVTGLPDGITAKYSYENNPTKNEKEYHSGIGKITLSGTPGSTAGWYFVNTKIKIIGDPIINIEKTNQLQVAKPTPVITQDTAQQSEPIHTEIVESNHDEDVQTYVQSEKQKIETVDEKLSERLKGKILLQVEDKGQAWYVNPKTRKRYYMANGNEAYLIMRNLGVGITNVNLEKIKNDVAFAKMNSGKIFLQVESHGEAFYIDANGKSHYLKNGSEAYNIMRELGLGIKNSDLYKIDIN